MCTPNLEVGGLSGVGRMSFEVFERQESGAGSTPRNSRDLAEGMSLLDTVIEGLATSFAGVSPVCCPYGLAGTRCDVSMIGPSGFLNSGLLYDVGGDQKQDGHQHGAV